MWNLGLLLCICMDALCKTRLVIILARNNSGFCCNGRIRVYDDRKHVLLVYEKMFRCETTTLWFFKCDDTPTTMLLT